MRLPVLPVVTLTLVAVSLAVAQSTVTTYTTDTVNGGQNVSSVSGSSDHTQSQIATSINGRQVPLEQHQERVIRSDSSGSVTESIVRRYDPTGQFSSTERTVTETHRTPGGGSTVTTTTYHSDINGSEQPAERSTINTRVSGTTTTVDTTVDHPSPNGYFQTVEKRHDVTEGNDKKSTTTETVYRANAGEALREAVRKVITQTNSDKKSVVDTTEYEPGINSGSLQFQERRVATTSSTPNGSQSTVVDVYAPSADGVVQGPDAPPQLKQEQIITSVKNPDGSVVETFSVREASVSEPERLGTPRQITQTVCTGKCGATPAPAPPDTTAPAPAKP